MADQRWANDYTRPYTPTSASLGTNRFSHIISASSPYAPGPANVPISTPPPPQYPLTSGTVWYQAAYVQPAPNTAHTVVPAPIIQQAIEQVQRQTQQTRQQSQTQTQDNLQVEASVQDQASSQVASVSQSQTYDQAQSSTQEQSPPQADQEPNTHIQSTQHNINHVDPQPQAPPQSEPQTQTQGHVQLQVEQRDQQRIVQARQETEGELRDTSPPQQQAEQQSLPVPQLSRPNVVSSTHPELASRRRQPTPPPPVEEEMLPPPPHDIDELAPIAVVRPCTMAHYEISPILRCPMVLKADYKYRMCEYCRLRFRLAEIRARGKLHEGKANTGKRKIKKIGQKVFF